MHVVLQLWVMGLLDRPETSSDLGDADRDLYASATSPYLLSYYHCANLNVYLCVDFDCVFWTRWLQVPDADKVSHPNSMARLPGGVEMRGDIGPLPTLAASRSVSTLRPGLKTSALSHSTASLLAHSFTAF